MDLSDAPSWSKTKMNKLGKALLSGDDVPAGCPTYNEVMLWHHELAAEVARIIRETRWSTRDPTLRNLQIRVSSRGKTVDTLVQKLERSKIGLEAIQDLAGVRVDGDFTLTQQTAIANAMTKVFSVDERGKRDLRANPRSGYRAYHLWVRCPAGRVEIQIRTEAQSEWANTYERLGDLLGREIRYDELPSDAGPRDLVLQLHDVAADLAKVEAAIDRGHREAPVSPNQPSKISRKARSRAAQARLRRIAREKRRRQDMQVVRTSRASIFTIHQGYIEGLKELRSMIEALEVG